ncbi:MFS transporter [Paenibacillus sp. M1]|uniref:MFS transporter n=1 Tax=Paenibacillus haidiansis TaxID=1574488 RepID=A0ABU7VRC9_9BACL
MNHRSMLRQEKNYTRLFAAGIVNGLGDRFSQVAVLGLLLTLTGSGFAVGINFAVRLIPFLVFGPLGGALADRMSKKHIMIATDLARAVFALSPLLVREAGDVWIIYAGSFLLAAGEALYAPARMSSIPRLVRKENLLQINSLEEVLTGIVLICGSVTGGFVSVWLGVEASFILNALSFLVTALILSGLPKMDRPRRGLKRSDSDMDTGMDTGTRIENRREFRELLTGAPFLRLMLVIFAVWPIGDGIFNILLSVYATEVFMTGDLGIGIVYGALGAGMVAGSGLTGKFARHIKIAAILTLLAEGILHTIISQSGSFILLVPLLVGAAVCGSVGNACNQTILMATVPDRLRGRFMGMLAAMQNTVMGTAMFLGGFALEAVSPRTLGLAGGLLLSVLGAGFAAVYGKSRHRYNDSSADGRRKSLQ